MPHRDRASSLTSPWLLLGAALLRRGGPPILVTGRGRRSGPCENPWEDAPNGKCRRALLSAAIAAGRQRRNGSSPGFPAVPDPCRERSFSMPTAIERSYVEQGYRLPEGLTWDMVAERRARWDIAGIFVPV